MVAKKDIFSNPLIQKYLTDFVGEEGLKTAKALPSSKAKSEYEIASDINMNINHLRSILYKFYSKNLVMYYRERDAQKGWFIYHWQFLTDKLVEQVIKEKEQLLKDYENALDVVSEKQFYSCSSCSKKYDFEEAFNDNFLCPSCRVTLELVQRKTPSSVVKKMIKELTKNLEDLKKLA